MSDWYLQYCSPVDLLAVREAMGPFGFSSLSVVEQPELAAGSVYAVGDVEDYAVLPIGALRTALEAAALNPTLVPADAVRALARALAAYRT